MVNLLHAMFLSVCDNRKDAVGINTKVKRFK